LEKAARRISWLVHDGLTGAQLTLSWFSRRIQPLRYNARLMCAYTGADDLLRVTRHDLPADSLKRRFKTLVKIPRGQQVPELIKDIYTNDQCPPVSFVLFVASNFASFLMLSLTLVHFLPAQHFGGGKLPHHSSCPRQWRRGGGGSGRRRGGRGTGTPQGGPSTYKASPRQGFRL
jgi:hypothetical protein